MAEVWLASDEVLGRDVAVKLLRPELANDPVVVERFRREAIAAARLTHPSIVSMYDTVSGPDGEAVVMEYVPGQSLREVLDAQGRLSITSTVHVGIHVAEALGAAHAAGIVHRDVKPGNILVTPDGRVLLSDFGIAKALDEVGDLSTPGMAMGTAKYVAPEQLLGQPVDGRADLYALGAVMFECLTGRPPYTGSDDAAVAAARLQRPALPVRSIRPGIPRSLDLLITALLARQASDRPATAADVVRVLQAVRVGADDTTLITVADPTPAAGLGLHLVVHDPTPPGTTRDRRWVVPLLVVAVVAVAAIVAGSVLSTTAAGKRLLRDVRHQPPTTTTPVTTAAPVTTAPVHFAALREWDPPPGDGHEHPNELPLLTDGNPTTAWETEAYAQHALTWKPQGIGLVLQLSSPAPGHRLVVDSPTQGWTASLYVSSQPGTTLAGWGAAVDHHSAIAGSTSFSLGSATGTWLLLCISDLGGARRPYVLRITEIQIAT
jgi:serine/threonine-protein kinase